MSNYGQKSTWNEHYKKTASWQLYPDENLVRLIKKLNPKKDSVLDFGCGSGRHILLFQNEGFQRIEACDTSIESKQVAERFSVQFQYIDSDSHIPYKEDSFSLIVAWGVLHYNSKTQQKTLLREFCRMLRNDGMLFGTVRSHTDTHLKTVSDVRNAEVQFFTEKEARALLGEFFETVEMGYTERTELGKLEYRISHWFFACSQPKDIRV